MTSHIDEPSTRGIFHYYLPPPDGARPYKNINDRNDKNYIRDTHEVEVENIRGKEEGFTFDTAGFQYYKHSSQTKEFNTDAEIEQNYYPESAELIKQLTGASRVILFDHTVRRHRPGDLEEAPHKRQPVSNVHIDQTPNSAVARVYRHLPTKAEADELLKYRFQIVNLWRPISHEAYDWPLGLIDTRSLAEKDLMPMTLKFPGGPGETYGVKYNPDHKWVYLRGMTPDEVVMFKCYDSFRDGSVCTMNAHSAFDDPSCPKGFPLRESIELRALVFYV